MKRFLAGIYDGIIIYLTIKLLMGGERISSFFWKLYIQ